MRMSALVSAGLLAALAAGPAGAACDARLTCEGPIGKLVNDPATGHTYLRMRSGDEANLACNVSGPAVIGGGLRLLRSSPIFVETYQLALLAAATTFTVRVTMVDAGAGACTIDTIVLKPYF